MIQKYAELPPAEFREEPQHDTYMDQVKEDISKITPQMSNPLGSGTTGRTYDEALSSLKTPYVAPSSAPLDPLEVARQTTFTAPNLNPIKQAPTSFEQHRLTPDTTPGPGIQHASQYTGKIQMPGDPYSYTYVDGTGFKIVSTPPEKRHLLNYIITPGKPGYKTLEDYVTNTYVRPMVFNEKPFPSGPAINSSNVHVEYPSISAMVNGGIITPAQADGLEFMTPVPTAEEIQKMTSVEPEYARQLEELLQTSITKNSSKKDLEKLFWFGGKTPFGRSNTKYKG